MDNPYSIDGIYYDLSEKLDNNNKRKNLEQEQELELEQRNKISKTFKTCSLSKKSSRLDHNSDNSDNNIIKKFKVLAINYTDQIIANNG